MLNLKVASGYAGAFFKKAIEMGVLEESYRDAMLFHKVSTEHKASLKFLSSPILTSEKKLAILKVTFTPYVAPLTLQLFELVSKRKREAFLATIIETFLERYYTYQRIERASITTTFKLSEALIIQFKSLIKSLTACKEVILTEHIDPSIQGGFIIRASDKQLDCSLAVKLYEIKKQFSVIGY